MEGKQTVWFGQSVLCSLEQLMKGEQREPQASLVSQRRLLPKKDGVVTCESYKMRRQNLQRSLSNHKDTLQPQKRL